MQKADKVSNIIIKSATLKRDKQLILSLRDSEIRYRRLFEAAQDGILMLNAETGAIIDVNPFMIALLGYSRDEFMEKKLWEVGAFKDIKASKEAFSVLQKKEYIRYKDLPLKAKDGRLIQVEFVSNVYWAGSKKVIQCNIRDITEHKHAQDALREQSVRDYLTGLFNRRYMEETLERELIRARRKGLTLGIIMLDVDNFKQCNDTWGHAAGDSILQELGSMLLGNFRGEDVPCRYGGDEFIIILPDASKEVVCERAELICEYYKQFRLKFEDRLLDVVTLSFGVAVFPEHGKSSDVMLRAADEALYRAKHSGRNQVAVAA